MAQAEVHTPPSIVQTELNYYLDPSHGGSDVLYLGTAGYYRLKHDGRRVDITDMRSVVGASEGFFSLDTQGFELVTHPSAERDYDDDARVKDVAYREAQELLKKRTGATTVVPVSHVIRKQTHQTALEDGRDLPDSQPQETTPAAWYVHIDQSYQGAREFLHDNLPSAEEAERLQKTRWGIINVWRPLQPVRRENLALCDARSVRESDLRPVTAVLPRPGSGAYAAAISRGAAFELCQVAAAGAGAAAHSWWYASRMTPDEALLFKIYDSKLDGRARRVPHTAFAAGDDSGPPRQSIEVRCLVFWEDQDRE